MAGRNKHKNDFKLLIKEGERLKFKISEFRNLDSLEPELIEESNLLDEMVEKRLESSKRILKGESDA